MEEKEETNARGVGWGPLNIRLFSLEISFYQRAAKGKIMTEEKYKGGKPGSLDLRVNYDAGCLYVGLGEASLYGKPSQVVWNKIILLVTF